MVLNPDLPIRRISQDELGREVFARALAADIEAAPADSGFVLAVAGPWGSGKTSVVNMTKEVLSKSKGLEFLEFNPWLFSGAEQLVTNFFFEIGAQLREKRGVNMKALGKQIETHGEILSHLDFIPFVGGAVAVGGKLAKAGGQAMGSGGRESSLEKQRQSLTKHLSDVQKRFVVVIDDIDRLDSQEIREVFRLVKLAGNFPNMIYVLEFDRSRVEVVLSDTIVGEQRNGRDYLEKIVQVIHDVPEIRREDLARLLSTGIATATDSIDHGPYKQSELNKVFQYVILPLMRSVRDVRRYVNSLNLTLSVIGDEINLSDVLALEAIRVRLPDVFILLPVMSEAVASAQSSIWGTETAEEHQRAQDAAHRILEAAGESEPAIGGLLREVFPASQAGYGAEWLPGWRKERRVAHPEVFRIYLEKSLGEGMVPARQVQTIYEALTDPSELSRILDGLKPTKLAEALGRLEAYEKEFPGEGVGDAVAVIMNQLTRPGFDPPHAEPSWVGPSRAVERIALRLLRHLPKPAQRRSAVDRALTLVNSVVARKELVELVGYRPNAGSKLLSKEEARQLEERIGEEILALTVDQLAAQPRLISLFDWVVYVNPKDGPSLLRERLTSDAVSISLLGSAMTVDIIGDSDGTEIRRPRLLWEWLTTIADESAPVQRIKEAEGSIELADLSPKSREAFELALRYASGWRPVDIAALRLGIADGAARTGDDEAGPHGEED